MIETQLILLEGPPGSGKTTTARYLSADISNAGIPCQCFLEWSKDNPIEIGDDMHLDQVVSSSITRESELLQQWKRFVQARQNGKLVTVMESRFWQTSLMLMYAAGYPLESLFASNQRVIETIGVLKPVLIWFTIDDPNTFMTRTIQIKEEEWRRDGNPGNWAQHIYEAFDSQKWFTDRGLSGLTGIVAFLEEWASVTKDLYDRLVFPKIAIMNPYKDWLAAMQQIRGFLNLV